MCAEWIINNQEHATKVLALSLSLPLDNISNMLLILLSLLLPYLTEPQTFQQCQWKRDVRSTSLLSAQSTERFRLSARAQQLYRVEILNLFIILLIWYIYLIDILLWYIHSALCLPFCQCFFVASTVLYTLRGIDCWYRSILMSTS